MSKKHIKIKRFVGENADVLNIRFNENDQAIIGDHTPEESERIIKEFIESEVKSEEKPHAILISGSKLEQTTYNKDNWKGQQFCIDNGTLTLQNDIDPKIDIKSNSLLIYEGYTVGLSKQQYDNIKNASEKGTKIEFSDCYFNDRIDLGNINIGIDKGMFDTLIFDDDKIVVDEVVANRTTMEIVDGTHIENLIIGKANNLNINCADSLCSGEENAVTITHLHVKGTASLCNCHVSQLTVDTAASVEIFSEVDNVCVEGIAYINESASIDSIHIHTGGKICGECLCGIDITCDRALRILREGNKIWIIG